VGQSPWVSTDPVTYELACAYAAMVKAHATFAVFRNRDEADAWLNDRSVRDRVTPACRSTIPAVPDPHDFDGRSATTRPSAIATAECLRSRRWRGHSIPTRGRGLLETTNE
jgi:hypothetical protein